MNILDNLYEIKYKNYTFFDRKLSIKSNKTIINGPRKSGKTSLIIDYMQKFDDKDVLYIDLNDERVDIKRITMNLENFLLNKNITLLIVENYKPIVALPNVNEIILTNTTPIEGFENLTLYPLDFEEFIAFETKHFNIEQIFNLFANTGTFPYMILSNQYNRNTQMQEMLHIIIRDETKFEIYKKLSEAQSNKISMFQIYNQLKQTMKISKDKLYKNINELINQQLLFLVEKFNSPKSNKKLFLIDFTLNNALSFKKDFLKRFQNIVFLELLKKGYKVYYTDSIDLYIPENNYGILCIPFLPEDMIKLKLQKVLMHIKELSIKKIDIVTVGNEGVFWLKNTKCSFIPFWDWALQD